MQVFSNWLAVCGTGLLCVFFDSYCVDVAGPSHLISQNQIPESTLTPNESFNITSRAIRPIIEREKTMWAVLPQKPWGPPNPNTISTTKPPPRRHSMAVNSIKNRQEMGGLGFAQAVITVLKSNEPQAKSKTKTIIIPAEKTPKLEELSGADVLKALQRATTHKAKKKKEKREAAVDSRKTQNQGASSYSGNVTPFCIKQEWSDRLEELEGRLQQLAHT
ncbi:hypothetical protein DH2020_029201 [Rehmannia glutinosa]|uniref:Uncharacterized protein n=1 Tax=Rehmannia glutinosa TaxID=99300 RepID=A0ABR0VS03_REHGL